MSVSARQPATLLDKTLRDSRRGFLAVAVFSFFLNLLFLVSPLYMLQVYDRVLASGSRPTLFYLTLIALVALAVFGVLDAVRTAVLTRIGGWLQARLGAPILRSSLAAANAGQSVGAQPIRDLQQLQGFLASPAIAPFFDAPWVPVFIAAMWILHPWIGILGLAAALTLFTIALINDRVTRDDLKQANAASIGAFNEAERITAQHETVHAMGMTQALVARWSGMSENAQDRMMDATERGGWITGLSRFIRMGVQVGILGLGALLVLVGELSAGAMIAGSILLGRALAPVEQGIGAWKNFSAARIAYRRLQDTTREFPADETPMQLPNPVGKLSVEGIFVRPPQSEDFILRNVGFRLEPGEALAVVGPSASGKSTLCRAIVGVMPLFKGNIRLDGADITQWPHEQIGRAIGYLPQSVELFTGTVRENIARMQEAEPQAVLDAAQLAHVHETILGLPKGYDTVIGPGGHVLSGGQKQRIGLARAVFGSPCLVLLDEPNAHLDQVGEQALLHTIATLKARGAAIVMVAHRRSAIQNVDKILVLRDGAVEVMDTRDEVMKVMAERQRFASRQAAATGNEPGTPSAPASTTTGPGSVPQRRPED
ncbi:type I secretion system permease/ATPase [Maricaulis sp. CAU 1757]